jgi:hypothetical protein
MFYGQTSNWMKIVKAVTEDGRISLPATAAQHVDATNAIRVHCGAEMQVQLHCQIFLTSQDDVEEFDSFLQRFGLPRNGYEVVNTGMPYNYSASSVLEPQSTYPVMIAPPGNNRP